MKSLFLALALAGVMLSGCATGQAPRPVPAAVAIAQGETTLEAAYNVVAHVYLNRAPSMDPALKAKVRRRCASPLCHSPVPTDGLSADWGAPHALGHRVRHHEGPQQGARSSRWCLSRAQLLTDTSLLRLLDEGRTGAG